MYKNETRYALINGVVLNGTRDMTPQTGKIVCVEGSRIAAVTDGPAPAGYEPVDLAGRYVLPGLINMHVHLPASGKPKKKPSDPRKLVKLITSSGLMRRVGIRLCEGYARTELLSGVTTIRTVGGVADFDTIIRDRAAAGEILSPRVVASNMAVSVPGGHMAGSLAYEARTPEETAAYVEKIAAEKPDLIKLMITGGVMDAEVVGEPGVLRMEPPLVKAACDKAHALGMKVAAHVESPEGVRVALENGVDSIEHGAKPDEDILRLFRERGAFQISTISPAVPYALFDRSISHATYEQQENGQVVFEGIVALAKACLENGIPVGLRRRQPHCDGSRGHRYRLRRKAHGCAAVLVGVRRQRSVPRRPAGAEAVKHKRNAPTGAFLLCWVAGLTGTCPAPAPPPASSSRRDARCAGRP